MKKSVRNILAVALAAVSMLPALSACTDRSTISESLSSSTSSAASSTTALTTVSTTDVIEPSPNYTALLSSNTYAAVGEELMVQTVEQYYSEHSHTVKTSLTDTNTAFVWPTTAFVEALAESYALHPENETIKNCYIDMLDNGFDQFKVSDTTVNAPSGSYDGITYYNAAKGSQGAYFYDDNAWICIRYLTAYEQFGNTDYLIRAEEILEFLWTGYDDFQGGGIYWDRTYSGNKGGCTNAPAAISYLWAYRITGDDLYLERGKCLFDWMNEHLRGSNGLYFAEVNHPWQPCYDQGTMIYAACLLYEITGDEQYYTLATQTARSVVGHMFSIKGNGDSQTVSMKRNPIFKAWGVGWLTRGIAKYISLDPVENDYMSSLKLVMDQTLATKDQNGQYDPFFCSEGTDFWAEDHHDNDVMQPSGIVIVFQLIAYYDVYLMTQ